MSSKPRYLDLTKSSYVEHFIVTFDHADGLWGLDLGQVSEFTGSGDVYSPEECEWVYIDDTPIDQIDSNKRVGFLQDAIAVMNDLTERD